MLMEASQQYFREIKEISHYLENFIPLSPITKESVLYISYFLFRHWGICRQYFLDSRSDYILGIMITD